MRRVLALGLAVGTACTTTASVAPHAIAPDLRIGSLWERTRFEAEATTAPRDELPAPDRHQNRRKNLFWTGIGLAGFGALGFIGFGVGGRVVQRQLRTGYEDGSLTYDRETSLERNGTIMNGLAIGSAVVGVLGVITAAVVYAVDNAKCGQLKPRRKACMAGVEAIDAARQPGATPRGPAGTPAEPGPTSNGTTEGSRSPTPGGPTTGPASPPPPETTSHGPGSPTTPTGPAEPRGPSTPGAPPG